MNMEMRDIIDISTNEVVGQAPWYNGEELAKMVDVAFDAQPDWERAPLLREARFFTGTVT